MKPPTAAQMGDTSVGGVSMRERNRYAQPVRDPVYGWAVLRYLPG